MSSMGILEEKLKSHFTKAKVSLYDVAINVGLDPSNTTKILYGKRPSTFEKKLDLLQKLSTSPLLELELSTMASWLAQDYLPVEVLRKAVEEAIKQESA